MRICDGCNVKKPWGHRCHGLHLITVMGERIDKPCECPECRKLDELFNNKQAHNNEDGPDVQKESEGETENWMGTDADKIRGFFIEHPLHHFTDLQISEYTGIEIDKVKAILNVLEHENTVCNTEKGWQLKNFDLVKTKMDEKEIKAFVTITRLRNILGELVIEYNADEITILEIVHDNLTDIISKVGELSTDVPSEINEQELEVKTKVKKCPKCTECGEEMVIPPPELYEDCRCENVDCKLFFKWLKDIENADGTQEKEY